MSRLSEIKKLIKLTQKNSHVMVEMKLPSGKTIKQLSNVYYPRLTKFELDCVYIHMYKILDGLHINAVEYKKAIENTNYAKVFGSPWSLRD